MMIAASNIISWLPSSKPLPSCCLAVPGLRYAFGDIHGMGLSSLAGVFSAAHGTHTAQTPAVSLGDFLDRGWQGLETIVLMCQLKAEMKEAFQQIRGNHDVSHGEGYSDRRKGDGGCQGLMPPRRLSFWNQKAPSHMLLRRHHTDHSLA